MQNQAISGAAHDMLEYLALESANQLLESGQRSHDDVWLKCDSEALDLEKLALDSNQLISEWNKIIRKSSNEGVTSVNISQYIHLFSCQLSDTEAASITAGLSGIGEILRTSVYQLDQPDECLGKASAILGCLPTVVMLAPNHNGFRFFNQLHWISSVASSLIATILSILGDDGTMEKKSEVLDRCLHLISVANALLYSSSNHQSFLEKIHENMYSTVEQLTYSDRLELLGCMLRYYEDNANHATARLQLYMDNEEVQQLWGGNTEKMLRKHKDNFCKRAERLLRGQRTTSAGENMAAVKIGQRCWHHPLLLFSVRSIQLLIAKCIAADVVTDSVTASEGSANLNYEFLMHCCRVSAWSRVHRHHTGQDEKFGTSIDLVDVVFESIDDMLHRKHPEADQLDVVMLTCIQPMQLFHQYLYCEKQNCSAVQYLRSRRCWERKINTPSSSSGANKKLMSTNDACSVSCDYHLSKPDRQCTCCDRFLSLFTVPSPPNMKELCEVSNACRYLRSHILEWTMFVMSLQRDFDKVGFGSSFGCDQFFTLHMSVY